MKKIRIGTFETNSSSTHSLCIVSKEEYEKWVSGDLLYNSYKEKFVKNTVKNADDENNQTCKEFYEDESLEAFEQEYKTKSGDVVIAFGKYGVDS